MVPSLNPADCAATVGRLPDTPLVAAWPYREKLAIIGEGRNWTWRQVHAAAVALCDRLRGTRTVCNLCNSRLAFLITYLAAMRGRCVQLLPPSGGAAELSAMLDAAANSVVVVDDAEALCRQWPTGTRCLLYAPEQTPSGIADRDLAWSPAWDVPVVRLFTSGSTGRPEPHQKTLAQLVLGAQALGLRLEHEIDGGLATVRHLVCSVPPQHMFGLEVSVLLPLVHGIAVLDRRPLLPADVHAASERCGSGTVWFTTPLHLRALAESDEVIANCSAVIASTMPLAPALAARVEQLVGAPVLEIYGSTETGAIAMRRTARDATWRPLQDVRVEPTAHGARVWGAHFSSPQTLADEIEPDGRGGFALLGRQADLIKIGGRRASLASLNLLLQDMPGLSDGVFYLPSTGVPTERLVLIYAGKPLDRDSALNWLSRRMDPVFLPRALIRVERMPRTKSGKLPRAALDAVFAAWKAGKTRP